MDINICVDVLGLNANEYSLTQSNTPHTIVEWIGDDAQPTQSELEGAWASYTATDYSRLRKAEYAKLNQYEMMFDDQRDSTTTWVDAVNAIKAQFPKPS